MGRRALVITILLAVIGFGLGYVIHGVTQTPPPAVVESTGGDQQFTPEQLQGFCCPGPGQSCVAAPDDLSCLQAGGYVFTYEAETCATICASASANP